MPDTNPQGANTQKNTQLVWIRESMGEARDTMAALYGVTIDQYTRWETGQTTITQGRFNQILAQIGWVEDADSPWGIRPA